LQNVFHKSGDTLGVICNLDSGCDTPVSFSKIQKNVFFECEIIAKYSKPNTKSIKIETFLGFDVSDFDDRIPCIDVCPT
jgi:hypothetical protein